MTQGVVYEMLLQHTLNGDLKWTNQGDVYFGEHSLYNVDVTLGVFTIIGTLRLPRNQYHKFVLTISEWRHIVNKELVHAK